MSQPKSPVKKIFVNTVPTTRNSVKFSLGNPSKRTCSKTVIFTLKTYLIRRLKTLFLKKYTRLIVINRITQTEFFQILPKRLLDKTFNPKKTAEFKFLT